MEPIDSIVELAAKRYQDGMEIQPALWAALNEHGITDPATRKKFCEEAGKILGARGGIKTAKLKRGNVAAAVRNEKKNQEQISLQFT